MMDRAWAQTAALLASAVILATGCVDLLDTSSAADESLTACPDMNSEGSTFYSALETETAAAPVEHAHNRSVATWLPELHWDASSIAVFADDKTIPAIAGWVPTGGATKDATEQPSDDDPAATDPAGPAEPAAPLDPKTDTGSTDPNAPPASNPSDEPSDEPSDSDPAANGEPVSEPTPAGPVADPIFGQPYDASVDPLQMISASQVDLSKDFMPTYGFPMPAFDNFLANGLQPGQKVPEIALWNLDGKLVKLSQYKDLSNVAIIVGSASCMIFRRHSLAMWTKLHQRAADATAKTGKKLEILVIYTQEAHPALENSIYAPQQQWTGEENVADKVLVSMTKTFAERVTLARGLDARFPFNRPNVWIDGADNAVWKMLGEVPNAMFLIDSKGTLVWKELWAMHAGTDWNQGGEPWPAPGAMPTAFTMIDKLLGL